MDILFWLTFKQTKEKKMDKNASQLLVDAKQLKKAALENAKTFLAESIAPHLEKAINKKINEDHSFGMDDEDIDEKNGDEEIKDESEKSDDESLDEPDKDISDEDSDDEMSDDDSDEDDSDDEDSDDEMSDDDSDEEGSDDDTIIDFDDTSNDDEDEDVMKEKMKKESKGFGKINGTRALKLENITLRQKIRKLINENARKDINLKKISKILKETSLLNTKIGYMFKLVNEGKLDSKQTKIVMESLDEANNISEAKSIYLGLKKILVNEAKTQKINRKVKSLTESISTINKSKSNDGSNKLINEDIASKWLRNAGIDEKEVKKTING